MASYSKVKYIKHKENGFVVSKANVQEEMFKILYEIYNDKSILPTLGQAIKTEVRNNNSSLFFIYFY